MVERIEPSEWMKKYGLTIEDFEKDVNVAEVNGRVYVIIRERYIPAEIYFLLGLLIIGMLIIMYKLASK